MLEFCNGPITTNLEGCIVIKRARCFLDIEQFDFKDRIGELRHKTTAENISKRLEWVRLLKELSRYS